MSKQQINIRVSEDMKAELEKLIGLKGTTINKFIADAIELAVAVEKNMDTNSHSRLVIENAKDQPKDYKLLLKAM